MGNPRPQAPWATIIGSEAGVLGLSLGAIRYLLTGGTMFWVTLAWLLVAVGVIGVTMSWAVPAWRRKLVRCPACGRQVAPEMLETIDHGGILGAGSTTACRYCLFREVE